jgi:transglutaminase-like putative cysteine protease
MKTINLGLWAICLSGMMAACVSRSSAATTQPSALPQQASLASATFHIQHSLKINDIPKSAETLKLWFWFPDDDAAQKILDMNVAEAPAGYRISRDPVYGHRYLYAEVSHPADSLSVATDFVIRRSEVSIHLDPAVAGELSASQRQQFAPELRADVPNMEVTAEIIALSRKICGDEQNSVRKAWLLFDWVVNNTSHYSRPNAPKSSGKGSAAYCLMEKGGSCTDMHSLFISLARAQGIPTRLQFGSLLKPANEGKEMDPGYRCWVEYFIPHYGWIPADLAAANTNPIKREFYFSGLDERRIRFLEGRDLELSPPQAGPRLNLLISAYIEIDGKPHSNFKRILRYEQVNTPPSAAGTALVLPRE